MLGINGLINRAQPRGDLGEVPLIWLTSPCSELREKLKCIEYNGKSKIRAKTSP